MYIQGKVLCPGICGCNAVEKDDSVILFQPAGEHLAVLLVGIDEARVTGVAEQMPSALSDVLVKRGYCTSKRNRVSTNIGAPFT